MKSSWKNISLATTPSNDWRKLTLHDGKIQSTNVDKIIKKWRQDRLELICQPEGKLFINPLRLSSISETLYSKWKKQQLIVMIFILAFAVAPFLLSNDLKRSTHLALEISMLFMFLCAIYLSTPSPNALAERIEYTHSLMLSGRKHLWFCFLMATISFIMSDFIFGSFDLAAYSYGAVINIVRDGEWWRIFTGSFIHSNITHWIINNVMLVLIFPIAARTNFFNAIFVFLVGSIFSEMAYVILGILGWQNGDILVGYSGGLYALLAFLIIDCIFNKECYPVRFAVLLTAFSFMGIAGAKIVNPKSSLIAHVSGFLSGVIIYFLISGFNRLLRNELRKNLH